MIKNQLFAVMGIIVIALLMVTQTSQTSATAAITDYSFSGLRDFPIVLAIFYVFALVRYIWVRRRT